MKKLHNFSLLLAILIALTACNQAPEKTVREGEPGMALKTLSLAKENALLGYETQNPLLLMSAAQMLFDNPTASLEFITIDETPVADQTTKQGGINSFDPLVMLQDAKLFAQGDENLLASIEKMEQMASAGSRGAVGGPYTIMRRVEKYSRNSYTADFKASQLAEVVVIGDGDTDLDLFIFDHNGNLISSDTDYTDRCYVSWRPLFTGEFTIVIENLGAVYNEFILITN